MTREVRDNFTLRKPYQRAAGKNERRTPDTYYVTAKFACVHLYFGLQAFPLVLEYVLISFCSRLVGAGDLRQVSARVGEGHRPRQRAHMSAEGYAEVCFLEMQ